MNSLKPLLVAAIVLLLAGTSWFAASWRSHDIPRGPIAHEEARRRWPEVIKKGFKEEPGEMTRIFTACFRKNDSVQECAELLATANARTERENGVVEYCWYGDTGEALIFSVFVKDYAIVGILIDEWLR